MPHVYQTGAEIVPGFRLVDRLGRGGFGEVWKVTAPGGTEAAVKIVSLVERYGFKEFRAIQRVKQIRHPNLVPIIGFWLKSEEGKFFDPVDADSSFARKAQDMELILAMGLGEKNLLDRLRECQREGKGGIPVDELLNYMQDAARALDYLNQPIHDSEDGGGGIQHCDVKPQNILIVGGSAQVCDFGLARVLGDAQMTTAKGTAAYMAPELILDNKPSRATDQYFLAISYAELRTGSLPLDVTSPAAAIWAHAQGKLDFSKLPSAEQAVLRKATSLEPEKRYATVVEMVRALRHACMRTTPKPSSFRPTRTDELAPGSEIVPGYRLIRMLGKGGYGVVWEALAPGGKHVALKVIRNLDGTQGRQEFRALELIKAVDHNHLMELHAYWLLDRDGNVIPDAIRDQPNSPEASTLVIASKLASQNLLQRLKECQAEGQTGIPIAELIGYMWQAGQAIDYLNEPRHALAERKVSIQHRDIKPENILLAANVVKVGDFGLAKVLEGTSAVIHGESAGLTLAYAAPEMFTNLVTRWSDQYSLAITYYRLRTGALPFPPGSTANDIIKMHVRGVLDLSRLEQAEREVIARATSAKPEERYADCALLVEELEKAVKPTAVDEEKNPTLDQALLTATKDMVVAPPERAAVKVSAQNVSTAVESPPKPLPPPVPSEAQAITVEPEGFETVVKVKEPAKPEPAKRPSEPARAAAAVKPATKPVIEPSRVPPKKDSKVAAAPPPAPSSVKKPKPSAAAWKGAAHRSRRRRSSPTVPLLLTGVLVVAVGVCAVLAVLITRTNKGERSEQATADVRALLEAGEYEKALDRARDGLRHQELAKEEYDQLRSAVRDAWIDQGERLLLQDPAAVAQLDRAVQKKLEDDPKARAFHDQVEPTREIRRLIAENSTDDAAKLFYAKEECFSKKVAEQLRGEVVRARLRDAEAALAGNRGERAETIANDVLTRDADNVQARVLLGKVYESRDETTRAFREYRTALPDPASAPPAKLPLLLAYLEFSLTSKGEKHSQTVIGGLRALETLCEFANHAVTIAGNASVFDRVRAFALGMRVHLRAARESSDSAQLRTRANTLFESAKQLVRQHPEDWASSLELARQLHQLAAPGTEKDSYRYRSDALDLVEKSKSKVPQELVPKLVIPLQNELQKRS